MLFSLWFECVVAETYGYGSNSASAPTLARPGNSCCETAGSRVVESSYWDRTVLDEADEVGRSGCWILVFSESDTSGMAARRHGPTGA